MKLEAVTVSVDYSRWLRKVVSNKDKFDRWIIATHESDRDTIRVCEDNGLEYVLSERVFDDAWFAKGRAINDALKVVDGDGWLANIDADIKLPDNFRHIAETNSTNKDAVYGIIRNDENGARMNTPFQRRVTRLSDRKVVDVKRLGAFVSIGYFQMWHSSKRRWYEEHSKTGADDDLTFAMSFKPEVPKRSYRENWQMLPTKCVDVFGKQGHFSKHYYGLRNLTKT
jgi:hypothetical protein